MDPTEPMTDAELGRRSQRAKRAKRNWHERTAERDDGCRQAFIERMEQAEAEGRTDDRGIRAGIAKAAKVSVQRLGQILDPDKS